MIKKCKVILRNPINMVVLFDGIEVQMPNNGESGNIAYIKYDGNNYVGSNLLEYEDTLNKSKKTSDQKRSKPVEENL